MLNKKRNNVLKQDKVGEDFEMVQKQQIKEDVENIGLSFEDLSSDSYTYKKLGLKAGEYVATYLPELFSGASKIASYIGDYSGKTSDCMNQAKHEDKNLVVCVLGNYLFCS
ncbi:hypothetical protein [Wolbachia endosymbiont of Chironomus riparius]|uniref:hypothetical protein n=1 Tax=Wolbachia endosymbiont of Chironomus riparius TaxID=2883238 RepID=UPI00209CDF27|nr:hypothetical protein [Wolbachia endosymbiont of Chironomus riparius]